MSVSAVFGARLREARKQKGLPQEQLAQELGVRLGSLNRWELGKAFPEKSKIDQIVDYFKMPLDWFFRDGGLTHSFRIAA